MCRARRDCACEAGIQHTRRLRSHHPLDLGRRQPHRLTAARHLAAEEVDIDLCAGDCAAQSRCSPAAQGLASHTSASISTPSRPASIMSLDDPELILDYRVTLNIRFRRLQPRAMIKMPQLRSRLTKSFLIRR